MALHEYINNFFRLSDSESSEIMDNLLQLLFIDKEHISI